MPRKFTSLRTRVAEAPQRFSRLSATMPEALVVTMEKLQEANPWRGQEGSKLMDKLLYRAHILNIVEKRNSCPVTRRSSVMLHTLHDSV